MRYLLLVIGTCLSDAFMAIVYLIKMVGLISF